MSRTRWATSTAFEPGDLIDADSRRGRTVEAAIAILRLCAHFDARHILYADHGTIGIGAQDYGRELFRTRQPSLRLYVYLDLLLAPDRGRANPAERGLNILAPHRRYDVVGCHIELGEAVGVEPDAQGIVERTKQLRLADAPYARQRIDHIDGGIVAQVDLVIGVIWRVDIDHLQQRR